ncbi:MAG: DEAD/DEAH box helicase family protein [Anaerolineae bacterium]|nr:DEAD/DEAH box helicase family protein [Anaerolineae bacterium]
MTTNPEWLELSSPPVPAAKKQPRDSAPTCPTCGWPVTGKTKTCPHCGHSLNRGPATNLLAELALELPLHLIEIAPAPPRWFDEETTPDPPALYHLRLQAERLQTTTGFDRLICLDDINVDHYRHQLEAALRALRDMGGQALLADEVGLGKTIEAGIIMKELIERGLAHSILILTPASLTWQWREEMETKFFEDFTVLENRRQLPNSLPDNAPCRWIVSLDRAKTTAWSKRLLTREYDLLIVDEAHKLKNHRTRAYQFVNQIRKRYVLMLTATPVHNDLLELYNLITILRPGHLGTRRAFQQNFRLAPPSSHRTVIAGPAHPTGLETERCLQYLNLNRTDRQAYRQDQSAGQWILAHTDNPADFDHLKSLDGRGRQAVKQVKRLLARGYEITDFAAVSHKSGWRVRTHFVCHLRLGSDRRKSAPRHPAALRNLLQEVMIRNRRSSVGVRFPPRQAAVYALPLTPPERELYDGVTAYIRRQLLQPAPAAGSPQKLTGVQRMTLMTLQKELCSSPQAAAQTLKKMVDRQADPQLIEYLVLAWGITRSRKIEAVLSILAQYPGRFLIFTDYLPSLHALRRALDEAGYETVVFHGGMSAQERVEAVRQFRQSVRVMISTRSGGEGHNLQFCHQLINYDLPWNPMRIEQRVGRLHRLGQRETVSIFNLAANDTIEAYILNLLAHKIRMFELVIGELDLILGELDDRGGFEGYLEDAWASSQSEEELQQLLAELEKILDKAQATYQQIRAASDELSDLLDAFDEVFG